MELVQELCWQQPPETVAVEFSRWSQLTVQPFVALSSTDLESHTALTALGG